MTYRDTRYSCPRCRVELSRRHHRESWRCATCRGVAVDTAALLRTLHHLAPELLPGGGASGIETPSRAGDRLPCPACSKPMDAVSLRGVEIDRCYHDQLMWFDATELDRVFDAVLEDHDAQRGWLDRLRDLLFAN